MPDEALFQEIFDPERFRRRGHRLIDRLADYLSQTTNPSPDWKALNWRSPEDLLERWRTVFRTSPNPSKLPALVDELLRDTLHLHHPHYLGHQTSVPAPDAVLAELVAQLLDPGIGVFEQGNAGVVMERILVEQLGAAMGMEGEVGGFLTSGGTLGNLTALLCARAWKAERDVWEQGLGDGRYAFLASEAAHFSVERAVRVMGMGAAGLIRVPVNARHQLEPKALKEAYRSARSEGVRILGVVANACSTAVGAFDPLEEIGAFCRAHDLWFHVDAAHGGAVLFSEKYRSLLRGIEGADSVVLDFHKMFLVPKLCTALVFRQAAHSYGTFRQQASYLWQDDEQPEWYNLGKRTFELTKSYMSLRVFLLWTFFGERLFGTYAERQFDLAKAFARRIARRPHFEMPLPEPEANIVCLRYRPAGLSPEQTDRLNRRIREAVVRDGTFFCVETRLGERHYLRTPLMNPLTTLEHLEAFLDHVEAFGRRLLQGDENQPPG